MFMPIIFSLATNENQNCVMSTQEDFTRLHRIFIYRHGQLGNVASADTYHMQLKQGKEYYFHTKISI